MSAFGGKADSSGPAVAQFFSAVTGAVFAARVAFSWGALVGELGLQHAVLLVDF
jgi:hypothetical protein